MPKPKLSQRQQLYGRNSKQPANQILEARAEKNKEKSFDKVFAWHCLQEGSSWQTFPIQLFLSSGIIRFVAMLLFWIYASSMYLLSLRVWGMTALFTACSVTNWHFSQRNEWIEVGLSLWYELQGKSNFRYKTLFHECMVDMRWQMVKEARSAELTKIISYPTSASGIIVFIKDAPLNSSQIDEVGDWCLKG